MGKEVIVALACVVVAILAVSVTVYLYIKDSTLDSIRNDVYQLFLRAEHKFRESQSGQEKMKWVLSQIQYILPTWAKFFVTESTLEYIIQLWFDSIKDLLDDGKYNKSTKG